MTERSMTIAILYPGEMGAALASLLRPRGNRLVTTLVGRSERTARRCREAGIVVLDDLADVARQSQIVISSVSPAAAEEVAAGYCELAHLAPPKALYVDANSIGPELKLALAERIARSGPGFVDAAINGLAKNLANSATLFLSGARAGEIERLLTGVMRVRVLGDSPGRAAAMKMLLAGLSKGMCALFAELALIARRQGMLGEMIDASTMIYPGVMAVIDRMLPTYAVHASRRATEMNELAQTARSAGIDPCVIAAVRRFHERLAGVSFGTPQDAAGWTVASLIETLLADDLLAVEPSANHGGRAKA